MLISSKGNQLLKLTQQEASAFSYTSKDDWLLKLTQHKTSMFDYIQVNLLYA